MNQKVIYYVQSLTFQDRYVCNYWFSAFRFILLNFQVNCGPRPYRGLYCSPLIGSWPHHTKSTIPNLMNLLFLWDGSGGKHGSLLVRDSCCWLSRPMFVCLLRPVHNLNNNMMFVHCCSILLLLHLLYVPV